MTQRVQTISPAALRLSQYAEAIRPHGPRFSLAKVVELVAMTARTAGAAAVEGSQRSKDWKERQRGQIDTRVRAQLRETQPRRKAWKRKQRARKAEAASAAKRSA